MSATCNLIIDSCCDLPFDLVDREGVYLIEFPYVCGEEDHVDDFYRSTTPHDFFQSMRDGATPTTSQLMGTTLEQTFAAALDTGIPTVYLSFSSGLSGSFDAAHLMRDRLMADRPGSELILVDTKLASIAEGLLVYEALRQRERGLSAQELAAWAQEACWFVNAQFMVDDLESLRRGGRIPSSIALAGAKLDVKPLLGFDLDGNLTLVGVARGRKKGIRALAEYHAKNVDASTGSKDVVIAGSDCPKDVERLKDLLSKQDDGTLFLETSIGPVIGSHVGPDMIALVFWGKDRREGISVADRIAQRVKGDAR